MSEQEKYSWMEDKINNYTEDEERRFIDAMKLSFSDCLFSEEIVDGLPMYQHIYNMFAKKLNQPVEIIKQKICCLT